VQEFEFQHSRPAPSRQSSYSSHDGRAFHERQRSQGPAASMGTSGLAGLNLMPQSLLPEIMPDIPQLMTQAPGWSSVFYCLVFNFGNCRPPPHPNTSTLK